MKRLLVAFVLSYVATALVFFVINYSRRELGQVVGPVYVWQELEVPDYHAGEYGNTKSELPFFWVELSVRKKLYTNVRNRTDRIPYFDLTTDLKANRFHKGLFLEVWDYDWSFEGIKLPKRLEEFLLIARDEIIASLRAEGITARPKGEIGSHDERDRSMLLLYALASFIFVPAFVTTVLIMKRGANQSPLQTPTSGTPVADAPVAPPPGAAGL